LRPNILRLQEQQEGHARQLRIAMQHTLERQDARLVALQQHLHHLDPQQVLARGYSMVRDAQGNIVVNSERIAPGEKLNITFAHGGVRAVVQEKWDL
jgi:exodeoxyribonuclease VII large subunit